MILIYALTPNPNHRNCTHAPDSLSHASHYHIDTTQNQPMWCKANTAEHSYNMSTHTNLFKMIAFPPTHFITSRRSGNHQFASHFDLTSYNHNNNNNTTQNNQNETIGVRRSPAVACWASDHWVASLNPLRGKFCP